MKTIQRFSIDEESIYQALAPTASMTESVQEHFLSASASLHPVCFVAMKRMEYLSVGPCSDPLWTLRIYIVGTVTATRINNVEKAQT